MVKQRKRKMVMAIKLNETKDGKMLEVQVSGKIAHEDYQHLVPKFEESVKAHGKVRMLFEMVDFHGWEAVALWDDIKFDLKHFADIERLAMVGDRAWEKGMATFCKPFTKATIRYFDHSEIEKARQWLDEA
jgi:hypothetical protein